MSEPKPETLPELLDRLEKQAEGVTHRPWSWVEWRVHLTGEGAPPYELEYDVHEHFEDDPPLFTIQWTDMGRSQDAAHLVSAVNAMPRLIEELRKPSLDEEVAALHKRARDGGYGPGNNPDGSSAEEWFLAIYQELDEVEAELRGEENYGPLREEIGDAIGNLMRLAHSVGITDPVEAARESTQKVNRRIDYIEANAHRGVSYSMLWKEAKAVVG